MTGTLISLISIFIGIIGANFFGYFKKKYSFGFTGNTLIGVFGSILFIKLFGRLGFNPWYIIQNESFHIWLFIINCIVSFLGGVLGLISIKMIYNKMNKEAAN
ncbi:hypothetical protein BW723_03120 [Polaribacter reichenbachii]|uniref:Uncharacterized protein n=1 Tax=Polaribacter reichenbachii TaxID=996801 RepID=A0A1B8TVW7_9FLAO|nr:hypothetical protein [Polaribacter reichenbachii]APZ45353.1 hypothetical protein BW723_03120 [Polaribacter reichenbachii]AUC19214.1 hypothetical protein BTO17_11125 [Polaribacter reichenbachii]OBY63629.1 hypothetical protein LPB301_12580 [Polaribacter reichenbachii]